MSKARLLHLTADWVGVSPGIVNRQVGATVTLAPTKAYPEGYAKAIWSVCGVKFEIVQHSSAQRREFTVQLRRRLRKGILAIWAASLLSMLIAVVVTAAKGTLSGFAWDSVWTQLSIAGFVLGVTSLLILPLVRAPKLLYMTQTKKVGTHMVEACK
jgi:hypothetical protein